MKKNISLTEILIAVVIMVVAFLPIMNMTRQTIKGTVKSENNFVAITLAKTILAHAKMRAFFQKFSDVKDGTEEDIIFYGNGRHEFFQDYFGDSAGMTEENAHDLFITLRKFKFTGKLTCGKPQECGMRKATVRINWDEDGSKYIELYGILRK